MASISFSREEALALYTLVHDEIIALGVAPSAQRRAVRPYLLNLKAAQEKLEKHYGLSQSDIMEDLK